MLNFEGEKMFIAWYWIVLIVLLAGGYFLILNVTVKLFAMTEMRC